MHIIYIYKNRIQFSTRIRMISTTPTATSSIANSFTYFHIFSFVTSHFLSLFSSPTLRKRKGMPEAGSPPSPPGASRPSEEAVLLLLYLPALLLFFFAPPRLPRIPFPADRPDTCFLSGGSGSVVLTEFYTLPVRTVLQISGKPLLRKSHCPSHNRLLGFFRKPHVFYHLLSFRNPVLFSGTLFWQLSLPAPKG